MMNPPVFPCERKLTDEDVFVFEGLSIRDYFAAKAMQSILPQYDVCAAGEDEGYSTKPDSLPFLLAKDAYAVADAMMEARK